MQKTHHVLVNFETVNLADLDWYGQVTYTWPAMARPDARATQPDAPFTAPGRPHIPLIFFRTTDVEM